MQYHRTLVFLSVCLWATGLFSANKPELDQFAQCLNQHGAVMYGAFWCPHCAEQKELFGGSFSYVNYVECGVHSVPLDHRQQTEACKAKDVHTYPTWIFNRTIKVAALVTQDNNSSATAEGKQSKKKARPLTAAEKELIDALNRAGGHKPIDELPGVAEPKTSLPSLVKRGLVQIVDEPREQDRHAGKLTLEELGAKVGCPAPKTP